MQPSPSAPDLLRVAIGTEREAPPHPSMLAPLFPDLEVLGLAGQGGMGAVYQVRRRADGAPFALKVVKPGPGQENAFAARFAREAEALERLQHPNIVAIHGHGQAGPWCWLLMDLVDGANLREIVATGRLSPAQTLALVPPLCAALQYAHDQGVVHRDLKPENILLDATGVPHLVDFGLAKLRDPKAGSGLTHSGAAMGTVHYMAPEQVASAKGVDHRADIYALGVVIYELLTGQLPLGRFEVPSQRVQVDVRIDEVVLKALERDPERRWQQMRMVGEAVAAVDAAPPAGLQQRTVWKRRHWAAMGVCALLGVVCVGLLMRSDPLPAVDPPAAAGEASRPMLAAPTTATSMPATTARSESPTNTESAPAPVTIPDGLAISTRDARVLAAIWRKQIDDDPKVQAAIVKHGQPLGIFIPEIQMVPGNLPLLPIYQELLVGLSSSSTSLVRVSAPFEEDAKITGRCIHSWIGDDRVGISFTVFLTLAGSNTPLWQGHQSISKERPLIPVSVPPGL